MAAAGVDPSALARAGLSGALPVLADVFEEALASAVELEATGAEPFEDEFDEPLPLGSAADVAFAAVAFWLEF
jgi:hypothetical protein